MFNLKNIIYSKYFGRADKLTDPNKDINGKGTNERFQEILAEEWDLEVLPLIDKIIENTIVPDSAWDRFIPYLEDMLGIQPISSNLLIRRKFIKNIISIYKVKGTKRSYDIVFKLLGFESVSIEELPFIVGFDSPLTFDADYRVFDDSTCYPCTYYNLHLTGTIIMNAEIISFIIGALQLVEPINAKLKNIIYNDNIVTFTIFVAENGDLIYEPTINDSTEFDLSSNGDLKVTAIDSEKYSLNNGDLKKDL